MPEITISTADEYEAVLEEIYALTAARPGSLEEKLLADLLAAAEAWESAAPLLRPI